MSRLLGAILRGGSGQLPDRSGPVPLSLRRDLGETLWAFFDHVRLVELAHPTVAMRVVRRLAELGLQERPPTKIFLREVPQRTDGEMKDIDRIPTGKWPQSLAQRTMIAAQHRDLRIAAMGGFEPRAVRAIVLRPRIADATGHPLREELFAVGSRSEVTPHTARASVTG